MKNCTTNTETRAALALVPKKETDSCAITGNRAWELQPHVCRECFGRLASRPMGAGAGHEILCTNCGVTTHSELVEDACCCGVKVRKRNGSGRTGGPLVDARIRCIQNPDRSPAFPSMYVARELPDKK